MVLKLTKHKTYANNVYIPNNYRNKYMSDALQGPQGPSQPEEYQMPSDQLQAELNLTEAYRATFMGNVLAHNLDAMKRFAGISIPQFKNPEVISQDTDLTVQSPELAEDIGGGFVSLGSTNGPNSFERMLLQPQLKKISQKEYDAMSTREQSIYATCMDGEFTEGREYPLHTTRLLKDIFGLIGAQTVRDDSISESSGHIRGNKLHRGTYMDTEVYIEERWNSFVLDKGDGTPNESYMVRSAVVYGGESGRTALNELSDTDIARLTTLGLNRSEIRKDGIDRTNINSYISNIEEINGIMSGNDDIVDQASAIGSGVKDILIDSSTEVMTEDGSDKIQEIAGNVSEVTLDALAKLSKRRTRRQAIQKIIGKNKKNQ